MGNLCSKSSNKSDPFAKPGRTLGSAPAPKTSASIPANASAKARTPKAARTAKADDDEIGDEGGARAAAARAAEERASKGPGSSKLEQQLDAQRKQTRNQTLEQASWENRAHRDIDEANKVRNHN